MKKTLLVLLALTLVASFGFAEAMAGGEASISGSVSLTAGYDLDNEGYGFVNGSDIQIVLPILGGDAGASGSDGVYAEIMIDDIGWEWNFDENPDWGVWDSDEEQTELHAEISATIHFNSFYLGLGNPSFKVDYTDISDDYSVDARADDGATGGFSLGFMNDMIDIALLVASENDYRLDAGDTVDTDEDASKYWNNDNSDDGEDDAYTPNVDGDLVFGVSATITPSDDITVEAKFMYDAKGGANSEDVMGFGFDADVAMGGFSLALPMDYVSVGTANGFEIGPSIGYDVMEGLELAAHFVYGTYTNVMAADVDDAISTGGSVEAYVGRDIVNAVADFGVTITDTEAFVPGLEWMLGVTMIDIMDYEDAGYTYTNLDVDVEASYNN